MKYKLGILGLGKMGSSILYGIIKSNLYTKNEILLYDINEEIKTKLTKDNFVFPTIIYINKKLIAKEINILYKLGTLLFFSLKSSNKY